MQTASSISGKGFFSETCPSAPAKVRIERANAISTVDKPSSSLVFVPRMKLAVENIAKPSRSPVFICQEVPEEMMILGSVATMFVREAEA